MKGKYVEKIQPKQNKYTTESNGYYVIFNVLFFVHLKYVIIRNICMLNNTGLAGPKNSQSSSRHNDWLLIMPYIGNKQINLCSNFNVIIK